MLGFVERRRNEEQTSKRVAVFSQWWSVRHRDAGPYGVVTCRYQPTMTRAAKATLVASCILSSVVIWGVHFQQSQEREVN